MISICLLFMSFVLIAVIGMALFAFVIAGVFDGNSFQSQDPIGKINGEKLSLNDFRIKVDVFKKSYNFHLLQKIAKKNLHQQSQHKAFFLLLYLTKLHCVKLSFDRYY